MFVCLSAFYRPHEIFYFAALPPSPRAGPVPGGPARAGKHAQREHSRACRTTSQRKKSYADAFQKQNCTRAHAVVNVTAKIFEKGEKGCASQAVGQFAPLLIMDVFLSQVTSVVLISLYFIHFMTIYIVIRPLI